MTMKGGGRTKLDINFFTETCEKEADSYFAWKRKWEWLVPEYTGVQKMLAETNLPKETRKKPDLRTIKPVPQTVNHEYGWISTKPEFQLQKWGPDNFSFALEIPGYDDL